MNRRKDYNKQKLCALYDISLLPQDNSHEMISFLSYALSYVGDWNTPEAYGI